MILTSYPIHRLDESLAANKNQPQSLCEGAAAGWYRCGSFRSLLVHARASPAASRKEKR